MSQAIQGLCEKGQELLAAQEYIEAEQVLVRAERDALHQQDWDTLARLYMPLQETRRQRRQRTCEGVICFDLVSEGPGDQIVGRHVIENYPHGQLLVAGWGTLEPAMQVRRLQGRFKLFVDVLLAAKEVELVPCSDFFSEAFDVFRSQPPSAGLSFADAAIVAVARARGVGRVASFDRGFARIDGIEIVPAA